MLRHLVIVLLFISGNGHGQPSRSFSKPGDVFIRFNPLGLVDLGDFHAAFGSEKIISDKFSVALDAGFIFYSPQFDYANYSRGFLIHPSGRLYPGPKTLYFEAEIRYRHVDHHITDWIWRGVSNGVPSYEEFTSFRYRKQHFGVNMKIGRVLPLTANKRFWWEPYMGIGYGRTEFKVVREPNSMYRHVDLFGFFDTGEVRYRPQLLLGARVRFSIHSRV